MLFLGFAFHKVTVAGSVPRVELVLPLPPFLRLLLARIRVNLVPHPTQHVRSCFSGHDERLDHRWWQLSENSAHCPCHPSLLVLPGGCVVDGQCSVCNSLKMEA